MRKFYCLTGLISCFFLVLFVNFSALAQRKVSGVVNSPEGPLPGVTVIIKGDGTGTVTDIDGKYNLSVSEDDILVFSFVGFETKETPVKGKSMLDVTLDYNVQSLAEVVVTGYQVQRKADISGAVAVVEAKDLENVVASSFAQKLAGRAPGVTVSTSGQPGDVTNVRIRGISSFGNNDPLYVIDGVPVQDKGNLNINPNDIESMQVLKDPSTASIYGSRASNGVVVITTKKGKTGKAKLTYSGTYSLVNSVKGWDDILITDSEEYLDMTEQFFNNGSQALPNYAVSGTLPEFIYVNPDYADGTNSIAASLSDINGGLATYDRYSNPIMRTSQGTNWWDAITRTGQVQDHYVNLSGGNEAAVFALGAGALLQQGVLEFNDFKRYNIRANSAYKIGSKLRVGENLNFSNRTIVNNIAQSEQGVLSQVYKIAPIIPVYDIGTSVDDEGLRDSFGGSKTANTGNASNPYAMLFRGRRNPRTTNNLMGNFYAELDLVKGLTVRSDFKFDLTSFTEKTFTYRSPENQENQGAQNFTEDWGNSNTLVWTNTLNYSLNLSKIGKFTFLAGYEALKGQFRNFTGSLNNYFVVDPGTWYLNPALGDVNTRQVDSNGGENALLSTFAKLDYSLRDKYYISGTVRRDGSSRFSADNRFAVFPAVSLAWRVSGESFLSNSNFIDDLKLRASWGKTGNENIVNYNYVNQWGGTVGSGFYAIDGSNSSATNGYHLTNVGTEFLGTRTKWEEASTINGGFDATFLNDKISLVLDVYQRKTTDLLYNAALPGTFGYLAPNAPFRNTASMTNTGFDIAVGYRGEIAGTVKFNVDINVSHYKNVIDKIDGVTDFFYPNSSQGRIDNRLPTQININQVGQPISSFRGYEVDGIYQSQEEINNLPVAGGAPAVGGLKFKDQNGDDRITDADLVVIGNPHPDFTYGVNLGASYSNFDLTVFIVGSQGNEIFNYTKLFTHFRQFFSNVSRDYYLDNGKGNEPKLNISDGASRQASDYYVENGSYLRIGQLQLAYTAPLPSGTFISGLRVFVQAQNLLTITKYKGLDPALSNANIGDYTEGVQGNYLNDLWTGFDIGQYPSNRMFTVGVKAEF